MISLYLTQQLFYLGFLNQLFALAYSFHQQPNLELAINFLETAIEFENFNRSTIADDNLTTDQILMMKVYYELACCNEEKLLVSCIINYLLSLLKKIHLLQRLFQLGFTLISYYLLLLTDALNIVLFKALNYQQHGQVVKVP